MAVKLRLRRMGKKKQPVYKVVAADSRSPRDGKFLEAIGLYNPLTDPATIDIKEDRALYWLGVGAQPTDTVKNLLSKKGILLRKDLTKRGLAEDEINKQMADWAKKQEAKMAKYQSGKPVKKAEQTSKVKAEQAKEVEAAEVQSTASGETPVE